MFQKGSWKIVAIALVVCILCSAITSTIQNSSGRVEVTETVIETSYGPLGLMILKPKTATLENPAPLCGCLPRFLQQQGNAEPGHGRTVAERGRGGQP